MLIICKMQTARLKKSGCLYIQNTKLKKSSTDDFCILEFEKNSRRQFSSLLCSGITSIYIFRYLFSPIKNKPTVPGPACVPIVGLSIPMITFSTPHSSLILSATLLASSIQSPCTIKATLFS